MLYDHVDLRVSDPASVRALYDVLMAALGYPVASEDPESVCWYAPGDQKGRAFFGIVRDASHRPNGTRVCFRADSREDVDRLAAIAREAGAKAFELAHLCEEYTPSYYATFFEDADGNKLEICYRSEAS